MGGVGPARVAGHAQVEVVDASVGTIQGIVLIITGRGGALTGQPVGGLMCVVCVRGSTLSTSAPGVGRGIPNLNRMRGALVVVGAWELYVSRTLCQV